MPQAVGIATVSDSLHLEGSRWMLCENTLRESRENTGANPDTNMKLRRKGRRRAGDGWREIKLFAHDEFQANMCYLDENCEFVSNFLILLFQPTTYGNCLLAKISFTGSQTIQN